MGYRPREAGDAGANGDGGSSLNPNPEARWRLADAAKAAVLTLLYVATARLGLSFNAVDGVASTVWPPTGISLVALLLFGYRLWPGVACGALLSNLVAGMPVWVASGIAVGNTLEALSAAYLLRRVVAFHVALERVRDVLGLIVLAGLLSTLVSATVGVTSAWLGGVVTSATYAEAWLMWWIGDAVSDLVVAPVLLTWAVHPGIDRRPRWYAEMAILLVLLSLTCLLVIGTFQRPVAWSVFPFIIWAALRLGQPGMTAAVLLTSVIATWATAHGHGAFAGTTVHHGLALLQLFIFTLSFTGLLFAAVMRARQRAEDAQRRSETRFRALIDKSDDALVLVDAAGAIVYASASAVRLHGDAIRIGQLPVDLVHLDDREPVTELLAELGRQPGHVMNATCRVRHSSGAWRWVEGTITNLLADPSVQALVANYRDVTERKDLKQRLSTTLNEFDAQVLERTAELRDANQSLSELSRRLLALRDEERRRIGRELHGGTAQTLAGLGMQLIRVQQTAPKRCSHCDRCLCEHPAYRAAFLDRGAAGVSAARL